MPLLKKKVTLLNTKDRKECGKLEQALKEAGLWCHTWSTQPMPVGGCGAQMRPTDWSRGRQENKDAQRVVWHLEVLLEDQEKAEAVLHPRAD